MSEWLIGAGFIISFTVGVAIGLFEKWSTLDSRVCVTCGDNIIDKPAQCVRCRIVEYQ